MDGTPFGRYRLVELLGRGGMGEVWRAHDTVTDRIVAIKLLPAHFSENAEFQERFRREAHAAARLNTPHVIPIHDYGEINGQLYVSMRLIDGRDLHAVLADGPLDPVRAVRIIEGVAKALHAAHKVGLVHRDVKPSNVLLDEDDFAYLIDFGIARAAAETRLTSTGNMIGTFQYMAPERFGSRQEDARADIYALACVLYECLTGQPPFAEDSAERLMVAHLSTPPPQPSNSQPSIPPQVDQVIATGMAKDPDNRYATTVELANAAHDAITTPIPRQAPPPPPIEPTQPGADVVREPSQPTRPATVGDVAPPGGVSPYADTMLGSPSSPQLAGQPMPGIPPVRERPPAQPPQAPTPRARPGVEAVAKAPDRAAGHAPRRPLRKAVAVTLLVCAALLTVLAGVVSPCKDSLVYNEALHAWFSSGPFQCPVQPVGLAHFLEPYVQGFIVPALWTAGLLVLLRYPWRTYFLAPIAGLCGGLLGGPMTRNAHSMGAYWGFIGITVAVTGVAVVVAYGITRYVAARQRSRLKTAAS